MSTNSTERVKSVLYACIWYLACRWAEIKSLHVDESRQLETNWRDLESILETQVAEKRLAKQSSH